MFNHSLFYKLLYNKLGNNCLSIFSNFRDQRATNRAMRRRFSTYLGRPSASSPNATTVSSNNNNQDSSDEGEAATEDGEVYFDSEMAFDEVSSPVLAYKFSGQDFDPDKCEYIQRVLEYLFCISPPIYQPKTAH